MNEPTPVPTAGTYLAMAELQGGDPWQLAEEAAREWAREWKVKLDTMWASSGVALAQPAQRLHAYLLWTLEDWQRKFVKYPMMSRWHWNDFARLRDRAVEGEWNQEIAAVSAAHWSLTMDLGNPES